MDRPRQGGLKVLSIALALLAGGAASLLPAQAAPGGLLRSPPPPSAGSPATPPPRPPADEPPREGAGGGAQGYTIDQAASWKAQLSTYAFSGLAFLTGTFGADTFLPPGKVADYFGFQYLRDIDARGAGHNSMFLGNIADAVFSILDAKQRSLMVALAAEQEPLYAQFADRRLPLIKAFRAGLEGSGPAGELLSERAVESWLADSFELDGKIAAARAAMYGTIVASLSPRQKAALASLKFGDSGTWPKSPDPAERRGLAHGQDVLFMTYASEFFSWYAGNPDADVYFCPERHATYFGGFYMKDYPAMGHDDYFISTALTGDAGLTFLYSLSPTQASPLVSMEAEDGKIMAEIIGIRRSISIEFRKYLSGGSADEAAVLALSRRYGELDGRLSWLLAESFSSIGKSLSADQRVALAKLRNQSVFPEGAYRYSDPIPLPDSLNIAGFFAPSTQP